MEVSGQIHSSATLYLSGGISGTDCIGDLIGRKAGLDDMEKRKKFLRQESNSVLFLARRDGNRAVTTSLFICVRNQHSRGQLNIIIIIIRRRRRRTVIAT
jgi:hypothetical protein